MTLVRWKLVSVSIESGEKGMSRKKQEGIIPRDAVDQGELRSPSSCERVSITHRKATTVPGGHIVINFTGKFRLKQGEWESLHTAEFRN